MLRLDECAGRPDVGAKAERLSRVRAAGLPALDGVVILPGEPVDDAALAAALSALLGERFIVRSSSAAEDAAGGSAAGLFESVGNARDLDEVKAAIARVRASAGSETARDYLRARGVNEVPPMAVLIQPMARAARLGVALSTARGWRAEERHAGEPEWGDVEARAILRDETGALAEALRALERFLGGPIDAEYGLDGENGVTIFQIRPRMRGPLEALDDAFAGFAEAGRWRLDAEHNPRPLSPAQAGLVELVDGLGAGPRQRVVGGWLYVEVAAPPRGLEPIPLEDLRRRFDEEVAPDCRARITAAVGLEAALAAFAHMFRRYAAELAPAISLARGQLDQFLRLHLGEPLALHGGLLGGLGGAALRRDQALWELAHGAISLDGYLRQFAAWAPAWDVATPTDEESPERVRAAARALSVEPLRQNAAARAAAETAAAALRERLDHPARASFDELWPAVRAAVEVGEDDDALFFEAQRGVRRALAALQLDLDHIEDVYNLPLAAVRAGSGDWKRLAAEGRAARAAAERTLPPPHITDGVAEQALPFGARILRGHPTSGRARGRAHVLADPSAAPPSLPEGAILVTPALLPSLAYLLPSSRALVTAHGGATSHGATLAREYGVPAVLGARGAEAIADGAELIVDGAAGRVYLL
jgi:phosphohistidine swiveling domain-containing protein